MAAKVSIRILVGMAILACAAWCGLPDTSREQAPQERISDYAKGLVELDRAETALSAHPDSLPLRFDRLRILYVLGIKEEAHLGPAESDWKALAGTAGPEEKALLTAYEGALRVARAKHGLRFQRKWEHLKAGLPLLDTAVARAPEHPEIRYLRLVSNYYLPFFMGRRARVKEDFTALARLLPAARTYPVRWIRNVGLFVLDKGGLEKGVGADLAVHLRSLEGKEGG